MALNKIDIKKKGQHGFKSGKSTNITGLTIIAGFIIPTLFTSVLGEDQ